MSRDMNVSIDLQNASAEKKLPLRKQFSGWAQAALQALQTQQQGAEQAPPDKIQLSIRIIDETESALLNSQYRGKSGATNILSFPVSEHTAQLGFLGDLAICAPVVRREATEQQKTSEQHWAHLIVHGVLHLNGYDHENDQDALEMEALEINILQQLGINNPYLP